MTLKQVLSLYEAGRLSTRELRQLLLQAKAERWPLSEAQKGLWVLHKVDPAGSAYNLPLCFRIDSAIDPAVLQQACDAVVTSHPLLSAQVVDGGGTPLLQVDPLRPAHVELMEVDPGALDAAIDAAIHRPFDLAQAPLWRTHLFRVAPDRHVVLFVIHHIVFDGGSIPPFLDAFWGAFRTASGGVSPVPVTASASYREFVEWEQALLVDPRAEELRTYWRRELSGRLPVLEMPSTRPRAPRRRPVGRTHVHALPASLGAQLAEFAARHAIGTAACFLGTYALLLHRYCATEDIVVGMPFARRFAARFDQVVGNFVNMLPLRWRIDDSQPALAFLQQTQLRLADAIDHGDYPFARIVRDLKLPRATDQAPVFQVAFEYQNASVVDAPRARARDDGALEVTFDRGRHQEGEYELVLEVVETDTGHRLHFKYDAALHDADAIVRMAEHYCRLLEQALEHPALPLHALELLPAAQRAQLIDGFNATEADWPRDRCVHELFAEQAAATPEAVALTSSDIQLTYRELDGASSRLAATLAARGVSAGDRVGLYIDRGVDMVVGLLGILKTGAAYVPLDPGFPGERLRYMVRDSGVATIVTRAAMAQQAQALADGVATVALDTDSAQVDGFEAVAAGRLAYVMYTSGSTGEPKGVMVPHRALTNFLWSMRSQPGLTASDTLFAVTTISFDIAGLELFLPLIVGARCHVCASDVARDPLLLRRELDTVRPTVMQATPTTWSLLLRLGWRNEQGLRILCGGEALPDAVRQQFLELGAEAWNLYGPTETTIWSTVHRIDDRTAGCIGRPIANTQVLIVDERLRLLPVGVAGELCIAGDGLADGYWNKPELTSERFVDHPFVAGAKLYRTGDLARWRSEGTLECLGRLDAQVKLRGFRIELEEIERHLVAHPGIADAAVALVEAEGVPRLVAFCIPRAAALDGGALRAHLQARVPDYMQPARYVFIDALPTTPNGKTDRKQLAAFESRDGTPVAETDGRLAGAVPAANASRDAALEASVAATMRTVLGLAQLAPDDGFLDVGGDSVLAVLLAERLVAAFGCEMTVTDVFRYGTTRRIAAAIAERRTAASTSSAETEPSPSRVTSAAQADGLAIIGISCSFPGAHDAERFWDDLCRGRSGMERLSTDELIVAGVPVELARHPRYVPVRAALADRDCFDAEFFKVTPRDAQLMDPQLRLLLQHAWKAVEDAGYAVRDIADTAVIVATADNGYQALTAGATGTGSVLSSSEQYVSWLLAQPGTVPTLVSHRLGLTGPSYAVHSNCSSSLTALHAATHCLLAGEARFALVGAASVYPTASLGYLHQKGLNFSSDGRVKTFDADADGLVGGEGAAFVLLKRTADALADGDPIYAVLRGIAVNNDGNDKAGFYAPSPEGQAQVIERVLRATGIDPRSIGYVEAHGTGTLLGDPIELTALTNAWRRFTDDRGFCAIGSVKSNIGHLDAAAGLAGCIKVALSLRHGEIVPSLHYRMPNPRFALAESPFFVATERMRWPQGHRARAALSSFGIGGTNAHALFEQAPDALVPAAAAPCTVLVPLSARSYERLRAYAAALADWLARRIAAGESPDLASLAYTLQIGREPMEARAAFVVADIDGLIVALRQCADGETPGAHWTEAVVDAAAVDTAIAFDAASDTATLLRDAAAWVRGAAIEWRAGHRAPRQRLHLPTYPFAPERHRLDLLHAPAIHGGASALHPLAQRNVSTLDRQRYASRFNGSEYFLRDHRIQGRCVLPGVAYLEMVRAAIADSLGLRDGDTARALRVKFRNVVWPRPLAVEGAVEIAIDLQSLDDGAIAFGVSSVGADGERVVHCQGRALAPVELEDATVDLASLCSRCPQHVEGDASYAVLPSLGFTFGPTFRAVQALHYGLDDAGRPQVVVDIVLPDAARAGAEQYALHPSLMDAAFGAVPSTNTGKPTLPFVIPELDVLAPCPEQMHVHVRYSGDSTPHDPVQKFDLDLCAADGRVCVRARGYARRQLDGAVGEAGGAATLLLTPRWQPTPAGRLDPALDTLILFASPSDQPVDATRVAAVAAAFPQAECRVLAVATESAPAFEALCSQLLQALQRIVQRAPARPQRIQVIVPADGCHDTLASVSGLLKTAALEHRKLLPQTLAVAHDVSTSALIDTLRDASTHGALTARVLAEGLQIEALVEFDRPDNAAAPWKTDGVYLITGGGGGLGRLFAADIADHAGACVLVLAGRTAPDDIDALRERGATVECVAVDVTDGTAVQRLVEDIVQRHGRLDGVLHAAGVVRDSYLVNKTVDELARVLAAKVHGVEQLDRATSALPLDLFVLFSSGVASFGNAGQLDYAAANAYLDAFATQRHAKVAAGMRSGRTLSIGWPLWREGGMHVDAATEQLMRDRYGMQPLGTAEGVRALHAALATTYPHVVVLHGAPARLRRQLLSVPDAGPAESAPVTVATPADDNLAAMLLEALTGQVAELIRIDRSKVGADVELSALGFDSITLTELSNALNTRYGLDLAPTIFFEYPTLRGLVGHLLTEQRDSLAARMQTQVTPVAVAESAERALPSRGRTVVAATSLAAPPPAGGYAEPIAVIGVSGRFPQAADVDAFWRNLAEGRDCVGEIPALRWDWRAIYGSDGNRTRIKWGAFIDGVDEFDPLFFGISPREAEFMDPQQRLLLMHCWHAIEDAGIAPRSLWGSRTAVFVGMSDSGYGALAATANVPLEGSSATAGVPSIAPNRVSYFLNLHGASEPIETACSSSLVAVHRAAIELRSGRCDLALAGGVHAILTPWAHISFSKAGMLSEDGRCKTFSSRADGYVRGEGIGMLVLKILSAAERDGDDIRGVILASAENHGGRANSLTAPNAKAQTDVLVDAYTQAGIDPSTVGYIEAHGTGTPLGDPVEVNALKAAFKRLYERSGRAEAEAPHCALGSVKTNIGHLEFAAGVAGIIKVLLQFEHCTIAQTLHCDTVNPYIDLRATPFRIAATTAPWDPPLAVDGRVLPRRAGVSSFGFGGVNAHVVLQEYKTQAATDAAAQPVLFVLSANSESRLAAYAETLARALQSPRYSDADLERIAYTLQTGRDAMECRLAFVASTLAHARAQLAAFAAGEAFDGAHGRAKDRASALSLLADDDDMQQTVLRWIARRKWAKLLQAWVGGLAIDWTALYRGRRPRRIRLPGYPFARERCWIQAPPPPAPAWPQSHPLLQENHSDLFGQRFYSTFSGNEFFLRDHVVQGARLLPASAHLEMARAAIARSTGDQMLAMRLLNVAFLRPVVVGDAPLNLCVALDVDDRGEISFVIRDRDDEGLIYSQGGAQLLLDKASTGVDLEALVAGCCEPALSAEQCYSFFRELGFDYGDAHRSIEHVGAGVDRHGAAFALARLRLPDSVADTQGRFGLHPSLVDGALQVLIVAPLHPDTGSCPGLPFAVESLDIYRPTPTTVYVHARSAGGGSPTVRKLDVDLLDENGSICASLRGYSARALDATAATVETSLQIAAWTRFDVLHDPAAGTDEQWSVLLAHGGAVDAPAAVVQVVDVGDPAAAEATMRLAASTLIHLQSLGTLRALVQVVVPAAAEASPLLSIAGLLRSAAIEQPSLRWQVIAADPALASSELGDVLQSCRGAPVSQVFRHADGIVVRETVLEIDTPDANRLPWREGGVYLIAGGTGGLGRVFATEIVGHLSRGKVIVAGRRRPADGAWIDEGAGRIVFMPLDVCDEAAVTACVDEIVRTYGRLDGVIHAAGVLEDSFLFRKSADSMQRVLAPKVLGFDHLDRATASLPLDLFVAFSSTAGVYGSLGQGDYACANGFLDHAMALRAVRVARGERHGRSLAVAWPYWADGGMRMESAVVERLRADSGMVPITIERGLQAFYRVLAGDFAAVAVLERQQVAAAPPNTLTRLAEGGARPAVLAAAPEPAQTAVPAVEPDTATAPDTAEPLAARALRYLRRALGNVLKIEPTRIEADAPLERYGIDSIMILNAITVLERDFGSLPKTLFFEHQTLDALSRYFVASHAVRLSDLLGVSKQAEMVASAPGASVAAVAVDADTATRYAQRRFRLPQAPQSRGAAADGPLDIAIIGLSGRYPMAGNLEAFWDNLREGRDCITEIPRERWDASVYFDADKGRVGKSYSKWGGFLDGVADFDALFFNISPLEAQVMDPQERLFLQCVHETLEDAGYTRDSLDSKAPGAYGANVGVYVGVMYEEYQLFGAQAQALGRPFALSGHPASIANRISYFYNFTGPSIALDTMCSSSLTCIHLAAQALLGGGCEVAIAGGVNSSIHPNKYLALSQGKFASSTGRCQTFGVGGDGYVPGEGVGAVLLKPLDAALADGDHVYGVIKGTAINHGGKTNGYTVPNPTAQSQVVAAALRQSRLPARAISYVEAHGTGTSLGDPIEIAGLTRAFGEHTDATGWCAIGSAKSNIGHCESAAGIAGLTKVLLQFKHGLLAPSLHAAVLNPHIDFDRSPFVVQRTLGEWKRPVIEHDGVVSEWPRVAGVSSFGAGGANAHLIVQEYVDARSDAPLADGEPVLVLLSAKNEARLRERIARLHAALADGRYRPADLRRIAYTLQVGREAMEVRLALSVQSLAELVDALAALLADRDTGATQCWRGEVKSHRDSIATLTADDDLKQLVRTWLQKRKHEPLADLWVKGLAVDWRASYGDTAPRRISLPTYPFAQERHWIAIPGPETFGRKERAQALHPLLTANVSTVAGVRFTTRLDGDEPCLADHVVRGRRTLPGAAYLEMARVALRHASGESRDPLLHDIVWMAPFTTTDSPAPLDVAVRVDGDGFGFEVTSRDGSDATVIHCRGRGRFDAGGMADAIDVAALRARCNRARIDATTHYAQAEAVGLQYGASHRGVYEVHCGEDEAIAELQLGAVELDFVLHPGLLDSALQACAVLLADAAPSGGPQLPFALDALRVIRALPAHLVAWVRPTADRRTLTKLDIDLCDAHGDVCVQLRGMAFRALAVDAPRDEFLVGLQTLRPVWEPLKPGMLGDDAGASDGRVLMIGVCTDHLDAILAQGVNAEPFALAAEEASDALATRLTALGAIDHIVWVADAMEVAPLDDAIVDAQGTGVLACFRLLKALLAAGFGTRPLRWTVCTTAAQPVDADDIVRPANAALIGLLGSVAKEYPHWRMRLFDLPAAGADWPWPQLLRLASDPRGDVLAWRRGEWFRQQLLPFDDLTARPSRYREGGLYVLVGGAGGIGEAWSEWMIRRHSAQIVWIGRRERDADIDAKIVRLGALGPAPRYIAADAGDRDALEGAYAQIKAQFEQPVSGVIHSAIVLDDKSIANMTEERFAATLRAKVDVSVRLAQVFSAEPLDFVLFFSSFQSFGKAPGQSNYAAGCTFKDAYAAALAAALPCAVRVVNWGWWGSLGIVASDAYRQRMARVGLGSIEPEEGMHAIERLLAGDAMQLAVVKTTRADVLADYCPRVRVVAHAGAAQPRPSSLREVALDRARTIAGDLPLRKDPAVVELAAGAERALSGVLWVQLLSMGLFDADSPTAAELAAKLDARYDRWLVEALRLLVTHDILDLGADARYRRLPAAAVLPQEAWSDWRRSLDACAVDAGLRAQTRLVDTTLQALPEILAGRKLATDFLFGNSSVEHVGSVYADNEGADYFNTVLGHTLLAYLQARCDADAAGCAEPTRLRILEIGAGTGGTSGVLFRMLASQHDRIAEYCYTDISQGFLIHAQDRFGPHVPYLRTARFNVEQPLAGQDIDVGAYDVVVATNVLHATRNIRETLRNTKAALRPGGLLLLNEINDNGGMLTLLTFGLLAGWWLYEDEALRIQGCPALTADTWRRVLEAEGFHDVFFPAQAAHALGQQVIVAGSDGVVRQALTAPRAKARPAPVERAAAAPPVAPVEVADTPRLDAWVRETIVDKLCEALRVDRGIIDQDDPFADYGVDSITGVNLVQTLNQAFGIDLATTTLFEYSSVRELTRHVIADYLPALEAVHAQKTKPALSPMRETERTAREAVGDAGPHAAPPQGSSAVGHRSASGDVRRGVGAESGPPSDAVPVSRPTTTIVPESRPVTAVSSPSRDGIAIIGMSGRFSGSPTLDALWGHLEAGSDLVTEVTRWDLSAYLPAEFEPVGGWCRHAAFIDGIDRFDALFFKISGSEATYMDPQQRLFLEECWTALEDAGYAGDAVRGMDCGVFVGSTGGDYHELFAGGAPAQAFWGNHNSVTPARIAYCMDLKGPAIAIDTACSSSLVAIHAACQSLWAGDTAMALAGGVHIQVTPKFFVSASKGSMLSPQGRCFTFDARADGFVPGEGVGVVVLKRCRDAVADGDCIRGVIIAAGVNQDGTTNGITAPNAASQELLLDRVYARFGIDPATIGMVEAHGTGTRLGDPIEFNALTRAFRKSTAERSFCALGSIKTNLGHTASASGVAGVLKLVLALQHRRIPASINYATGNPAIELDDSPFYVNTALRDWQPRFDSAGRPLPRRGAVSSFGFGGTNAHLVIEEAPAQPRGTCTCAAHLVVLAARTDEQLGVLMQRMLKAVQVRPDIAIGDLAYTLMVGRKHLPSRFACVAHDRDALIAAWSAWLQEARCIEGAAFGSADAIGNEDPRDEQRGLRLLQACRGVPAVPRLHEHLGALAELFASRVELPYRDLFDRAGHARVALPTYPFAGRSYWVQTQQRHAAPGGDETSIAAQRIDAMPVAPVPAAGSAAPGVDIALVPVWEPLAAPSGTRWIERDTTLLVVGSDVALASAGVRALRERCRHAPTLAIDGSETIDDLTTALQRLGHIDALLFVTAPGCSDATSEAIVAEQTRGALAAFRLVKALLACGYETAALQATFVTHAARAVSPHDGVDATHASVHGLVGSIAKEFKAWRVRMLDLPASGDWPADAIVEAPADPLGNPLCWRNGEWFCERLVRWESDAPAQAPYRDGATYVVIGGAGGVGDAWSEAMIRRHRAQIVWLGRRPIDAAIERRIAELGTLGPAPAYLTVDAADPDAMRKARDTIVRALAPGGRIHGIVHSALVLDDRSLAQMSEEQFAGGLRAKVDTSVRLAQIFANDGLEFVLLFSSIQSFVKAPGQANYAAGCTFSDAYGHQLSKQLDCPVKVMNWGYWGSRGSVSSPEYQARMGRLGFASIEPEHGMRALDVLHTSSVVQMAFLRTLSGELPALLLSTNARVVTYGRRDAGLMERIKIRMERA